MPAIAEWSSPATARRRIHVHVPALQPVEHGSSALDTRGSMTKRFPQSICTAVQMIFGNREARVRSYKRRAVSAKCPYDRLSPKMFPQSICTMENEPNGFRETLERSYKWFAVSENRLYGRTNAARFPKIA